MTREVFSHASKRLRILAHQLRANKKGAHRFIETEIELTEEEVDFDTSQLGGKGRRRLRRASLGRGYRLIKGIAHVSWKDDEARRACIEYQEKRRRWKSVEKYKAWIVQGKRPRFNAVYLHPTLAPNKQDELVPIDGTRRLLAFLEAGFNRVDVIVIVPTTFIDGN